MIINILITYCIVMCWWCYSWLRKNINLKIQTNRSLIFHFMVILGFSVVFIGFLRLLAFFKNTKAIYLNTISLDQNICFYVLGFILLYSFSRLSFYFLKLCWFKLHFFLLSPYNLSCYAQYRFFFLNIVYSGAKGSYNFLWYLNILMFLAQVYFIINDLYYNNMVLDFSLSFLNIYAIFKLLYMFVRFLVTKLDILLDYYSSRIMYLGVVDEDPFHLDQTPEHRKLMGEAQNYCYSLVRESYVYSKRK